MKIDFTRKELEVIYESNHERVKEADMSEEQDLPDYLGNIFRSIEKKIEEQLGW